MRHGVLQEAGPAVVVLYCGWAQFELFSFFYNGKWVQCNSRTSSIFVTAQLVVAQSWYYPRSAGVSPAFLAGLLVVRPRWPRSQAPTF